MSAPERPRDDARQILVTGATGRVGSRFVPRLLQHHRPEDVRILVRDPSRAATLADRGVDVVVGDLVDPEARRKAVAGMDAVVHVAAGVRTGSPEAMPAVNTEGAVALAREALAAGVSRFVHVSTNLVYGPGGSRPAVEDDPLRPREAHAPYSTTKAAAERGLSELHRTAQLGLRIVRLAFVYGESDPHLAESMQWARGWAPHQRLQMIHHADVAQAVLLALHAEGIDGRVYNAADDAAVTAFELAALNGETLPDEAAERIVEHPWDMIVSTERIRTELGFRPIYPTVWTAWHAGAL